MRVVLPPRRAHMFPPHAAPCPRQGLCLVPRDGGWTHVDTRPTRQMLWMNFTTASRSVFENR